MAKEQTAVRDRTDTNLREALMLDVHERGSAVVGVYSYDVAKSKVRKATMMARSHDFPLRLECKPE